ncbi:hypothetical protein AcV7_007476 [Taiwanofungus camphoratus]|nr:hypothetical protein AcV7_007476 [Antrodia cinnamomea]
MLKYYQVIVVLCFSCSAYVFLCFPPFFLAFAFPSLQIFTSKSTMFQISAVMLGNTEVLPATVKQIGMEGRKGQAAEPIGTL